MVMEQVMNNLIQTHAIKKEGTLFFSVPAPIFKEKGEV